MSAAAPKLMTADEFLVWCLDQEGRWELVGGAPILMMTGTTQRHDRVTVNLIIALGSRLRGSGCVPTTDDVGSRMMNGNIRRPDVTVDCSLERGEDLDSTVPTVFFEVLSPSTHRIDFIRKPEEYKRVPTLKHFAVLNPAMAQVFLWSRNEDGTWIDAEVSGLDAVIPLDSLGIDLPMAEVYEGVDVGG